MFNTFHMLQDFCVKAYDNKKQLAAEVAMLKEKLAELDHIVTKQNCIIAEVATLKKEMKEAQNARLCMEKALIYVKNQFFTL